ncbi:dTDP-glucose 4,6-dehydratase 1 [Desulfovibrionales bacterium]
MRLLVTGCCGFIGSNYLYYLFEQHPDAYIVNLDKLTYAGNPLNVQPLKERFGDNQYHFIHGDISDMPLVKQLLAEHHIEAVINFAAESHVDRSISDPTPFITTNVLGTQVLLEAAHRHKIDCFVHISTDEVYGTLGSTGKFTEETPLAPNSPYSASKACADLLIRAYVETYNFPAIITRCSNNYGPYQFPEKLIPLVYAAADANKPLPIYGDGMNIRDWIYVKDHCRGVHLALTKGTPGRVYNFGGNAELSNIQVVKTILRIMGKSESLISYVKDRPGHDRRYAMDYSFAQRELGFVPEYDFKCGIQETIAWYRSHTEWLNTIHSGAYLEFMKNGTENDLEYALY